MKTKSLARVFKRTVVLGAVLVLFHDFPASRCGKRKAMKIEAIA